MLCKKSCVKTEGTYARKNLQLTRTLGKICNYQNELCNFSCHKKFDNKPLIAIQIYLIFIKVRWTLKRAASQLQKKWLSLGYVHRTLPTQSKAKEASNALKMRVGGFFVSENHLGHGICRTAMAVIVHVVQLSLRGHASIEVQAITVVLQTIRNHKKMGHKPDVNTVCCRSSVY